MREQYTQSRFSPCNTCATQPCMSAYNEDGECWQHFESQEEKEVSVLIRAANIEVRRLLNEDKLKRERMAPNEQGETNTLPTGGSTGND